MHAYKEVFQEPYLDEGTILGVLHARVTLKGCLVESLNGHAGLLMGGVTNERNASSAVLQNVTSSHIPESSPAIHTEIWPDEDR